MKAVSGRNVVKRHEDYAFYRPSAVAIARVVQDFPLLLAQVIPFCKSCLPEAHMGCMRLKKFANNFSHHHVLHDRSGRGRVQVLHLLPVHLHHDLLCYKSLPNVRCSLAYHR